MEAAKSMRAVALQSRQRSPAVIALQRYGVPSGAALISVELWHRGVNFYKRKAVRLSAKTGDRLTRLLFDRNAPPPSQDMTIIITGVAEENLFSADLLMGGHDGGTVISVSSLHKDINRLLVGVLGVTVKDLGRFTSEGVSPYCMLISLDEVFALARQHWIYEKFSEYSYGTESVVIVRLRSRYNSRSIMRLIWDNASSLSRSQAQVLNEKEWRVSRYRHKSKELAGLTDVKLLMESQGRILAFL